MSLARSCDCSYSKLEQTSNILMLPFYLQSKSQWDDQIFVKGCIHALEAWLPRNIYIVAGVFIAISLLQVSFIVMILWKKSHVCR